MTTHAVNKQAEDLRAECTPRKFTLVMLACCLAIALSVAVPARIATAADKPVTLLTGEWPPYISRLPQIDSSGLGGHGLVADLVELTVTEMGYAAQFSFLLWPEVLPKLDQASGLTAFPYRETPERRARYYFSAPIYQATGVFYYNILKIPEPSKISRIQQLYEYRIGFIQGYDLESEYGGSFKQAVEVSSLREGFDKLIAGEIDLLPVERRVGELMLGRFFPEQQHTLGSFPQFSRSSSLHLICDREDTDGIAFIEAFNQALARLQQSGLYQQVEARYSLNRKPANQVVLSGPSNFPLAVGSLDKDSEQGFLIPRGTSAIVVEWDPLFTRQGDFDAHKDMYQRSRVKILEGPLKDHLLWVPNLFLSFE